jgi:hypothetical protein
VDTLAHWRRSLSTGSRAGGPRGGQPASRTRTLAPRVRWRHERKRAGFFTRNAALDWSGNFPFRTAGKMDKPLRC